MLLCPGNESAEVGSADLSEVVPTERRADAVVTQRSTVVRSWGSSSRCSWVVTAISRHVAELRDFAVNGCVARSSC